MVVGGRGGVFFGFSVYGFFISCFVAGGKSSLRYRIVSRDGVRSGGVLFRVSRARVRLGD